MNVECPKCGARFIHALFATATCPRCKAILNSFPPYNTILFWGTLPFLYIGLITAGIKNGWGYSLKLVLLWLFGSKAMVFLLSLIRPPKLIVWPQVLCPVCSKSFQPGVRFICPECGEPLEYDSETIFGYLWFVVSLCLFPVLLYFLGVRNFFAFIGGIIIMYHAGFSIHMRFNPAQTIRKLGTDNILNLRNKTDPSKVRPPKDS
jgi:predicted nucleic acid-binding Zn ribbon protein